jgi:hypothetical protein
MIFVCEAKYSIKNKDHPNNENYDSFGRIVERISAKGLFDALDEFESSLEIIQGNNPRWRDYEIIKGALDE